MSLATFSYHTCCTYCHGEGTVEVEVPSMSGVGGFIIQTQGCPVCKGTGASDNVVTVTYCDVCDSEECAGCESARVA